MGFLREKKVIESEGNLTDFMILREIWFDFYPRNKNTSRTSSGFEHVFLSEIKKGQIIGWERIFAKFLSWQPEDYFGLTPAESLILLKLIIVSLSLSCMNWIWSLHNWLYFYELEKVGKLDYRGWFETRDIADVRRSQKFMNWVNWFNLDCISLT